MNGSHADTCGLYRERSRFSQVHQGDVGRRHLVRVDVHTEEPIRHRSIIELFFFFVLWGRKQLYDPADIYSSPFFI